MMKPSIFTQNALSGSKGYVLQGDMIKLEPTFIEPKMTRL